MHLDVGVVLVGLAGKHRGDLAALGLGVERLQRLLGLGDDAGVALLLAHADQLDLVAHLALKLLDALDLAGQVLALAHHASARAR